MALTLIQNQCDPFKKYCIRVFSHVRPNCTFLHITNYINNWNEQADFNVCFNINYLNAVKRSLEIVKELKINLVDRSSIIAKKEIINSFELTLNGTNPYYTCAEAYESILDANGKVIPGIKLHSNQNSIHINAFKLNKKIIKQGQYPVNNSSSKALAKRAIMKNTPLANWVQFKLEPGRFDKLTVQKMTILG
ncbi:MAG: hypothetical protein Q8P20_00230 [bacterium]|nr:hypothetical protein [bacterium]